MYLWIKSYGCLNFLGEVWARRACDASNQQELTTSAKKKGQEEELFFSKDEFRVASQQPAVARQPQPYQTATFFFFQILFSFFWKVWKMDLAFPENRYTTPPFFEACPYTWKC